MTLFAQENVIATTGLKHFEESRAVSWISEPTFNLHSIFSSMYPLHNGAVIAVYNTIIRCSIQGEGQRNTHEWILREEHQTAEK
jgi:hypothetical protein